MLEKNNDYIEFLMRSMMVTHKPYTDDAEIGISGMIPEREIFNAHNPFDIPCDVVMVSKKDFEALQTENEQLKKKLHEFDPVLERFLKYTCGGQVSVNGWAESAKFWKKRYDDIFKLVGFSSVEEIQEYLTNNGECDTLHEAILKLIDEDNYACEEWCKANSENNSWKATAECDSPKELIEKIEGFDQEIKILDKEIAQWKAITKCETPEAAETWMRAYKSNCELLDKWQKATDCPSPNSAGALLRHYSGEIDKWQKATGCSTPEEAKELICSKNGGIVELKKKLDASLTENEELKKEISDYKEQIKSLYKVIEAWNKVTCCSTPEETKDWVAEIGAANGNLAGAVLSWKKATGYDTPNQAKSHIKELEREVKAWEEVTGFSTPKNCSSYIDTLEKKLEDIKDLIEED